MFFFHVHVDAEIMSTYSIMLSFKNVFYKPQNTTIFGWIHHSRPGSNHGYVRFNAHLSSRCIQRPLDRVIDRSLARSIGASIA